MLGVWEDLEGVAKRGSREVWGTAWGEWGRKSALRNVSVGYHVVSDDIQSKTGLESLTGRCRLLHSASLTRVLTKTG